MKIILIITICLLVIIATLIVIWGIVTKWKFTCKKKDNYEKNKPNALTLLQKGVKDSPEYVSLGNKLGKYFFKKKYDTSWDQLWCSFYCGNPKNFNDTEIKAYIKNIKNALPLIKKEFSKIKPDKSVKNDAVMHIRCSDVPFTRHSNYHLQTKAYYKWIADKCKRENIKAINFLLCTNHRQNKKHLKNKCNKITQIIRTWMKEFLPNVEMKPVTCLNILKSYQLFLGCKVLAQGGAGPSSFSFFPGLTKGKNFLTPKFIDENLKNQTKLLDKWIVKFPWSMWGGNPIWHSTVKEYYKKNTNRDPIIIKFFADWKDDKSILNQILKEYNWKMDKNYNTKYKFTDSSDFTHAIIFNRAKPILNISKKNAIGLAQEPIQFLGLTNSDIEYYKKNVKKYFIGKVKYQNKTLPDPFIEKFSYLLPLISIKNYLKDYSNKNKIMNYVYSKKKINNNYKGELLYNYRHLLGESILENNLPIDIYGTATENLKKKYKQNNIKNGFKWEDMHKIYKNYKFSIVIENTRNPEYFTEKIMIPLLCGCIPIYLGCLNINNYFKNYVIHLTGDLKKDINIIAKVLNNPDKYYKKININEIQEIIHIKNIINKEFITSS